MSKCGPILGYKGSKFKKRKQILAYSPHRYDMFVSPFCGGASVEFEIPVKVPRIINDLNSDVTNLWKAIQGDPEFNRPDFLGRIQDWKRKHWPEKENESRILDAFEQAKLDFLRHPEDPFHFLILNRYAHQRLVRRSRNNVASFEPAYLGNSGFGPLTEERLLNLRAITKDMQIWNEDFRIVLHEIDALTRDHEVFVFLDPTYPMATEPFYGFMLSEDDHEHLARWMAETKARCVLCNGGDKSFVERVYLTKGFRTASQTYRYQNTVRSEDDEFLMMNFNTRVPRLPPGRFDQIRKDRHLVRHLLDQDKQLPALGLKSMLSTATKIGPSTEARAFNLPIGAICLAKGIASSVCRDVCYGHKMAEGRPEVPERARKNREIVKRRDFVALMLGALRLNEVKFIRIHSFGDFYSPRYIRSWMKIISATPQGSFWAYTRSWVLPHLVKPLTDLATLSNMQLFLSFDQSMPEPPPIPHTMRAYLSLHEGDEPSNPCDLAFRSSLTRKTTPLLRLGTTFVCPHQNGTANPPGTCVECSYCLPREVTTNDRRFVALTIRDKEPGDAIPDETNPAAGADRQCNSSRSTVKPDWGAIGRPEPGSDSVPTEEERREEEEAKCREILMKEIEQETFVELVATFGIQMLYERDAMWRELCMGYDPQRVLREMKNCSVDCDVKSIDRLDLMSTFMEVYDYRYAVHAKLAIGNIIGHEHMRSVGCKRLKFWIRTDEDLFA